LAIGDTLSTHRGLATVSVVAPSRLGATLHAHGVHVDWQCFNTFSSFHSHIQRTSALWPAQVRQALRLMALHGIVDPLSGARVPAADLGVEGTNYRESFHHKGCLARHRAVLLVLQELIASGQLPPLSQLQLYCPEFVTPFAEVLRQHIPHTIGSEYLPDPADPRRQTIPHQDLCNLTLGDAEVDLVVCNEMFEHLHDLPAALGEIARVLRPGGRLVATFPFAYNRADTIVKARHRPGATPGVAAEAELLGQADFHGNPMDPQQGSLVYQIPGWDLLDQARSAGLSDPTIHWIAAPSYGVVGQEIPAVLVLVAGLTHPAAPAA
jgi:SAM-dependent methyltransferase